MKVLKCVSSCLMTVGALNLGVIGLCGVNVVTSLLGSCCPWLDRGIHILIGLAGIHGIIMMVTGCSGSGVDKKGGK